MDSPMANVPHGQLTTGEASALDVISARVFRDLSGQLARVHKKRGALSSDMAALGVITEEYHEVREAMQRGEAWKVRAELLDLAIGAIRRVLAMDSGELTREEIHHEGHEVHEGEEKGDSAIVAELRALVPWGRKGVPVVGSWEVLQGVADVLWGGRPAGGIENSELGIVNGEVGAGAVVAGPGAIAGGISDGSDGSGVGEGASHHE